MKNPNWKRVQIVWTGYLPEKEIVPHMNLLTRIMHTESVTVEYVPKVKDVGVQPRD